MNIDWHIDPAKGPSVPPRPGSAAPARGSHRRFPRRTQLMVAGAAALALAVASAVLVGTGASDPIRHAAAGSAIGHQDPFEARQAKNLSNVWSHDFVSDPTELLVEGDDAFVVTPNAVTDLGTDQGNERWHATVKDAEPFVAANRRTVLVAATNGFEAVDRDTGRSRWRVGVADPLDRGRTVALAQVRGEEVAVAVTEHGVIVGLNGESGATMWSADLHGSPRGRLVVHRASGSVALETTDGEHVTLRMFDAATGTVDWSVGLERDTGVPAFVGDLVLVGTGRAVSGTMQAYSVADGSRRWETPATDGFEETMAPAVVGTAVIFVDKLGMTIAVDPRTGKVQWSDKLPGPVLAGSPAVANGVVVIHDLFAQVHTLDLRTGRLLASRESIGVPIALGAAPNRIVYAQSQVQHGQVMAYAPALLASRTGTRP